MSEVETSEQTQDMRASWHSETLSPFEIEWAAGFCRERWRAALGKQGPIREMGHPHPAKETAGCSRSCQNRAIRAYRNDDL
jgi:hypothetical protein